MKVGIGEHRDMSVAQLVLKEPNYVAWVLSAPNPSGPLARVKAEVQRLIEIFDSKPFQSMCGGRDCAKPATLCSVYRKNTYLPYWWCDTCDPHQTLAGEGTLERIKTYQDALDYCHSHRLMKKELEDLIKTMAENKGLPKRVGEAQADAFFQ